MNLRAIDRLAMVLADLRGQGHQIILVSSGAIGVGVGKLGLTARPTELRMKQAVAAVGQCELMHIYDKLLGEYGATVAQILLTDEDVDEPRRASHLENTFAALLELGCIPVVNENDSVSSAEIETGQARVLGDNDTLSAIVARLCRADLLVLMSDIDGLYDKDPRKHPDAQLVRHVTAVTQALRDAAGGAGTARGTGGMQTKLDAAALALSAGIDMVITNGAKPELLYDIAAGADVGTRFCAQREETLI
jgi:glutamate 5-kinase